jgi:hypothetical protein
MNTETVRKTTESYMNAFDKQMDIFSSVNRYGSGYTYYIGENFDAISYPDLKHATGVIIKVGELFEWGKPKMIEERYWVYTSDYFRFKPYRDEPFEIFHIEHARQDEEGNITPAQCVGQSQNIRVYWSERGYGLKNWSENKKKLIEIAIQFSDKTKDYFLSQIEIADKQIINWQEAIKKSFAGIQL